jgi:hypothetical protein
MDPMSKLLAVKSLMKQYYPDCRVSIEWDYISGNRQITVFHPEPVEQYIDFINGVRIEHTFLNFERTE